MLKTSSELIVDSWNLYVKNWRKFLPFMIMICLPIIILLALGTISLYLSVYLPQSSLTSNLIILLVFAASIVFAVWVRIAMTKTIYDCLLNKTTEWKETFSASSSLIWPSIVVSFLITLVILGGTFLLIIPGIIFAVWYSFASYAVILDGATGLNAMRASKALTIGRWGAIAWRLLVATVVFGISNSLTSYLLTNLIKILSLPAMLQTISVGTASALVSAIFTPLMIGSILILYKNAKENPVVAMIPPKP